MNRNQRRADAARARRIKAPVKLKNARADGRPLFYDINGMEQVGCYWCELKGMMGMRYRVNEAYMADPANAPDGSHGLYTVCKGHLPDDAVIYNPTSNKCRNKSGTNTWEEDHADMDSTAKIAAKSGVKPYS